MLLACIHANISPVLGISWNLVWKISLCPQTATVRLGCVLVGSGQNQRSQVANVCARKLVTGTCFEPKKHIGSHSKFGSVPVDCAYASTKPTIRGPFGPGLSCVATKLYSCGRSNCSCSSAARWKGKNIPPACTLA